MEQDYPFSIYSHLSMTVVFWITTLLLRELVSVSKTTADAWACTHVYRCLYNIMLYRVGFSVGK